MEWNNGWMNTWLTCPNGHGVDKGYTSPELALEGKCPECGAEFEGFRLLEAKE